MVPDPFPFGTGLGEVEGLSGRDVGVSVDRTTLVLDSQSLISVIVLREFDIRAGDRYPLLLVKEIIKPTGGPEKVSEKGH